MSFLRNSIGLAFAVGFGYWNVKYAFGPAFEEEQRKREAREKEELAKAAAIGAKASNDEAQAPKSGT